MVVWLLAAWLRKVNNKMAKSTFGKAFAKARKEQGAGGTFVWLKSEGGDGESYSTNIAGETGKKKPSKGFSVDMASKAIDNASAKAAGFTSIPRPPPSNRTKTEDMPTEKGIRMPKAGDIKVSKLDPTTKVAGRGGFASGPAAGMPQNKAIQNYKAMINSDTASASQKRSAKAALLMLQASLKKNKK